MKGDFTRLTFRPEKRYHGVLKQQGRVDLDADWNEQNQIVAHRIETEAVDVIGPSGAPIDDAGFRLSPTANGAKLQISAGRAYVDGVLCENFQQNLTIDKQPDLPNYPLPTAPGVYLVYLDVWERHITALDDRDISEPALGGPDTCTRAKTVWQVRLSQQAANVDCASAPLPAASSGKLAARVTPTPESTACSIAAAQGYTSLQNQLYRVEIHDPAVPNFKWSRDNGCIAVNWVWTDINNPPGPSNILNFTSPSPSDALGFAPQQWVELIDDTLELSFSPGVFVQIQSVGASQLTVSTAADIRKFPLNPKIRRWDSAGPVPLTAGSFLLLENGVEIEFSGTSFTNGDYWLIPARTLTASVDWPVDPVSKNPLPAQPKGIKRRFAKLAIVQFDGQVWKVVSNCLPTFPPLTQITPGQDKGIHVTGVQFLPQTPLPNDSDIPVAIFLSERTAFGVVVTCDAPLDPVSVTPATCIVDVETPYPLLDGFLLQGNQGVGVLGFQRLILRGAISLSGNALTWTLINKVPLMRYLYDVMADMMKQQGPTRLRVRVTLKGDQIWGLNDPTLFLDGDSFGKTRVDADGTKRIDLSLPSGDGKRGGDFEFWFWLLMPVTPQNVTFNPVTISAGQTSAVTVALTGPAPAGGAIVTLTAQATGSRGQALNPASVASFPATVTVPAGQSSAPAFNVTGTSVPAGEGFVTLNFAASYGGGTQSASPPLTINPALTVASVNLNPNILVGDNHTPINGSVTLSGPAPAGGAVVALSYSNPNFAFSPPPTSVTVAAGQVTSPVFAIVPKQVVFGTPPIDVTVTATLFNSAKSNTFRVTSPLIG